MATNKAIKDESILRIARAICTPDEDWTSQKHAVLIWKLFREELGYVPPAPQAMAKKWDSLFNNGRLAYSSNCAKGLAEAGVCRPPSKDAKLAEYE